MSRMAADFFAQSPVLGLPLLALALFSIAFVAIVIRAIRTPNEALAHESQLPLTEDRDV